MGLMKEREAIVEGIFYPEDREKLSDTVLTYIHSPNSNSSHRQPEAADVFGIIVPHAGYNYCGEHTGRAFSRVAGKQVETVLLLGPVHRDPEEGIFLSESEQFLSPLGPVNVNQEINEELLSTSTIIIRNDIPHLEEHSLEVQLPFIQILFPKAAIVPVLMGTPSPGTIHALARALDVVLPDRLDSTLVIVSGNASTFIEKTRAEESAETFRNCVEKVEKHSFSGKTGLGRKLSQRRECR